MDESHEQKDEQVHQPVAPSEDGQAEAAEGQVAPVEENDVSESAPAPAQDDSDDGA